jgi:hypothetical protein
VPIGFLMLMRIVAKYSILLIDLGRSRPPVTQWSLMRFMYKKGTEARRGPRDEVVLDRSGKPLFRIGRRRTAVIFVISNTIPAPMQDAVRDALCDILQKGSH